MIRILQMIGSLNVGGSQSMIMNLYRNIDRDKIQFDFIVDHPKELYFAEEIKEMGGKIYVMPTFTGTNIIQIVKEWNQFFKKHKEYKIIHSHVRSYASIFLLIAKKHGLKTIIHSHSISNGTGVNAFIKHILQFPLRFEADYFFGCSKESAEWLFGKGVVEGKRYKTLQNAIHTTTYEFDKNKRNRIRESLNISSDTLVFGHVGRLHEAKNHMFLIEVFQKIHEDNTNTKLILVGDGLLRKQIEKKIYDLKLQDSIFLVGMQRNVNEWLFAMDVFLFPSCWEGLPVTVVEAQATGLPCFLSDMITLEVGISELVTYLPINQGCDIWVKTIKNANLKRKDVKEDIRKSGFDIENSVLWLSKFYTNISK